MQVEIVQPNIVFDIASLMLYGAQATPIRLKILLDRLFSVLQHEEVLQVLHSFGWSYEDYARGYILQDRNGRVLDKWSIASREEEQIILQQFLRFGETKSIAQEIILQDTKERQEVYYRHSPRTESDIKKFIERSSLQMQSFMRSYETQRQQQQALLNSSRPAHTPTTTTSTPRLLSPNGAHIYSASSTNSLRDSRPLNLPNPSMSPVSHSPLNRLQTMQPYDLKREAVSPHVSPASAAEKRSSSIPPSSSPINLPQRPMPGLLSMTPSMPDPRAIISSRIQQQQPEDLSKNSSKSSSSPMIVSKEPEPRSERDRDRPSMALNFSKMPMPDRHPPVIPSSMSNGFNSLYAERKIKHLRKSANPIKRNWTNTPVTAYGGSLIGPTGKKRVLCTACNKTFCDKGALKIHYSAVHLKEMHSCTVEGCNMLFSSRRSRNRHSANPNPKLHRPMKQKLPEGARIVDDGGKAHIIGGASDISGIAPQLLSPTMSTHGLPASSVPHLHHQHADGTNPYFVDTMERYTLVEPSMKKQRLDLSDDDDVGFDPTIHDDDDDDDDDEEIVVSEDVKDSELAVVPSAEERFVEPVARSTSKRKSQVPVRCKQMEEMFEISDENSDENLTGVKGVLSIGLDQSADSKDTSTEVQTSESTNLENMNMDVDTDPESHRTSPVDIQMKSVDTKDSPADAKIQHDANFNTEKPEDTSESQHLSKESESKAESVDSGVVPDKNFPAISSNQPVFPDMDPENSPHREINVDNLSDAESNASFGSNESGAHLSENGDGKTVFEIPMDKENPRRCVACGKIFQNHFTVKTHYQNVHLKLMHTCTIEGCNAAFPSKRSRDRHSSNLNLHRKLLSTAEQNDGVASAVSDTSSETQPNTKDEEVTKMNGRISPEARERIDVRAQLLETLSLKSLMSYPADQSDDSGALNSSSGGDAASITSQNSTDQTHVECHLCKEKFRDNLVLKEHCEKIHPKEMYYCTVGGCDKMFSTRKSRNRHSQNDNLHRHLGDTPSCTP
ncbi:zinc finger protein basonuclin-2-like [Tubulanus polymorphus]|uniref:zinc finger protein basonuclin-2-like n=1 Tax=Tubulanus polymorphus TaxID=672921 RepID=UPI003DA30B13